MGARSERRFRTRTQCGVRRLQGPPVARPPRANEVVGTHQRHAACSSCSSADQPIVDGSKRGLRHAKNQSTEYRRCPRNVHSPRVTATGAPTDATSMVTAVSSRNVAHRRFRRRFSSFDTSARSYPDRGLGVDRVLDPKQQDASLGIDGDDTARRSFEGRRHRYSMPPEHRSGRPRPAAPGRAIRASVLSEGAGCRTWGRAPARIG